MSDGWAMQIERASAERQSLSPKRAASPSMHTSGQAPSFLDRMGMDLQERKHRLKVSVPFFVSHNPRTWG